MGKVNRAKIVPKLQELGGIVDSLRNFAQMKKLTVDLKNCHGIKALAYTFDFDKRPTDTSRKNVYAIYAQNGVMKSSLARTFKDVADQVPPTDHVNPDKPSACTMLDEAGQPIKPDSILVVFSYDGTVDPSKKTSTLLVSPELRKEYDIILREEEDAKERLFQALQKQSGISKKKNLEEEISTAVMRSRDEFIPALKRLKEEVNDGKEPELSDIPYEQIFDDKIMDALRTPEFQANLEEYVKRYTELLEQSVFFKKGIFEYYNATTIAKTLSDNGFFNVNHSVLLNRLRGKNDEPTIIKTQQELEDLIATEREEISNDLKLKQKFFKLEKTLEKNQGIRDFRKYLVANDHLIPRLRNLEQFRDKVWVSYLKSSIAVYNELLDCYDKSEKRKQQILQKAREEQTKWDEVITLFNNRFSVPFKLKVQNQFKVMVGADPEPRLGFEYIDGSDATELSKDKLLEVLSTGEKKAFYLLSVIFQVQVRRASKQETVFVMDDIADSFDYKNKYAIIQYLKEIADEQNFQLIILTHNFDFYRIVNGRFIVPYSHCLVARKEVTGIELENVSGIQNPFVNDWKEDKFTDGKKKIASIAFFRNLIEYFKGENDPDYLKLTSLLHWKDDTLAIKVADLDDMFYEHFRIRPAPSPDKTVFDLIEEQAKDCLSTSSSGFGLERKIVLSIAIRLNAERFMKEKISDPAFFRTLEGVPQTQRLIDKYKEAFRSDDATHRVLNDVALMTPENIHLNSFMYEPILDMSDDHLRKLYLNVKALH